ncbi:MAG: replication-associated recombination protein A [Sulfurovaceae bacterium]|nr:replication-associated recombination protein A [Sulfurovaceae bacterium]MDD5548115.1 replication-associated recombination protein A [Sulfurovaceae bacterium]
MIFAHKYRPKTLDDIIGQEHLIGKNGILKKIIESNKIPHLFFYGPAGCGKTTLSRNIANKLGFPFYELNATTFKIEELRNILKTHTNALSKPLIFIDEVHRLSKTQQEVLLPFMERYDAIMIGASTQNPYYTLTSAIRSRSHLFELKPIKNDSMVKLLEIVIKQENISIDKDAKEYLVNSSGGDVRAMLGLLENACAIENPITLKTIKDIRPNAMQQGSNEDGSHYDLTSAMIKSIRGSDIDASLYYLARLIEGGESGDFIARRLCILASEDIGNANPNALILSSSVLNVVLHIGFPEARIPLAQLVVYLASSPKSNSSYEAINMALQTVQNGKNIEIPNHIKTHSKEYLYPHNFGGWVEQEYLSEKLNFYHHKSIGFEKTLQEWIEKITKK